MCSLLFSCVAFAKETGIPYDVVFQDLEGSDLESFLRSVSQCEKLKTVLPTSQFVLVRRMKKDERLLASALRSRGYFSAKVTGSVDFEHKNKEVAQLVFHVKQGVVYHFGQIKIQSVSKKTDLLTLPTATDLGLVEGEEARARKIFTAEEHLLTRVKEQGFAFAKVLKRHTQVDHDKHTLDVALFLEPGRRVVLGTTTLEGTEEIASDFIMARIPWEPGTLYHPQLIEKARHALLDTRLFSILRIQIMPEPDEQEHHPVTFDLVQRKHRSIRSGLGYGTETGAKIAASWEHRNAFGAGETVEVETHVAMNTLHLEGSFAKPSFLRMQQKLRTSASLDKEETEAFHKDSFSLEAELTRSLKPELELSYGLGYRLENVEDKTALEEASFGLFSLPVKLVWDKRDDLLRPSEGWYMGLSGAGVLDTLGTGVWFGKFSARFRHYYQLLEHPKLVLAGRLGMGTILGSKQEDIPADERFFVGGGGSVRGYGFQMASTMGNDKSPVGGRSMLEFSAEARLQVTQSIGAALFLDGGRAFVNNMPNVGKRIFLGPGGGLRYETPLGPLRLDIAVPLNRRPEIDSSYQVYMSIGQAF